MTGHIIQKNIYITRNYNGEDFRKRELIMCIVKSAGLKLVICQTNCMRVIMSLPVTAGYAMIALCFLGIFLTGTHWRQIKEVK